MNEVRLSRKAMATQWEIVLFGERRAFLQAVAEEVMDEIQRLEGLLSLFISTSDIADINRSAHERPVVVDPRVFNLIHRSIDLSIATNGAFDITLAPLLKCWKLLDGKGALPSQGEIDRARELVGERHISLDPDQHSVAFDQEGVMLDLGAIGKGYAVDVAIELVRDHGIESALLHSGGSTICCVGTPPEEAAWPIKIKAYLNADQSAEPLLFHLKDQALSVSAPHGKFFEHDGQQYGHVLDPSTGSPVQRSLSAAVVSSSAEETDALSTALLTSGPEWLPELARIRPDVSALVVHLREGEIVVDRIDAAAD